MNVLRSVMSGQISRHRRMRSSVFSACAGPLHQLEYPRAAVLEGYVEVGQYLALRHQRDHLVDVRVRVDVMQPHPDAERAERAHEIRELRVFRAACPESRAVSEIRAVGAGVLRDDQQFLDAGLHQALRLLHDLADRPAREIAAHRRDDAEAAAVIAALGDLQIGVVARRQPDALRRHQVDERVVRRRQLLVHRAHHLLVGVRPGDLEYAWDASVIVSRLAPRQPVTMTRPLRAIASPMASSDSCYRSSMKPQVLTTTRSASS